MFHPNHRQFTLTRLAAMGALLFILVFTTINAVTHRSHAASQQLTFEARVAAQRTIEEVYHRHRIWPADNPQPKPPLDAVLTEDALRAKVEDALRLSTALEVYFSAPLTATDLQAEVDRMARDTHQPDVLRELWAALGNDPLLVAECLARPLLAERLAREKYEGGRMKDEEKLPVFHPSSFILHPFEDWWRGVRAQMEMAEAAGGEYRLPELAAVAAPCGGDAWTATSTTGAPSPRSGHTAVWTGSEMIIWGGDASGLTNTGGRYNPATDSWSATNTTDAPSARGGYTAVWTGSEMIIWGGSVSGINAPLNTGGRYNPATNSWTATNTTGAPTARFAPTSVWTGSEMIVWGGILNSSQAANTGGRYNPTTNTWTATSINNVPATRVFHTAVWTGSEMIVWGGDQFASCCVIRINTGGRYNPTTDTWVATSTSGVPTKRENHTAVWTGSEMIIWGGSTIDGPANAGRYNPTVNTWTPVSLANAPLDSFFSGSSVWTGSEMIVWGGGGNTGGRYNPSIDSWTATTMVGAPTGRSGDTAVWTGSEMIVWGGSGLNTGGRYTPALALSLVPTTQSFTATGGTGNVAVTAQGGCTWTATSNANWLTITQGSSGAGNGTVTYDVVTNTLGPRTGLLTIGTQNVTVRQAGVATPRVIRVVSTSAAPGSSGLAVPIELVAQGDENALGFTLSFDPALLSNPQAALGADAAGGQLATVTTQTAQGRLGIGLALAAGQRFAAGTRQIAVVTFNLAATAQAGMTTLDFGDQPLAREVSDASAVAIPASYTAGGLTVVPGYEADVTPRPNGSNNGTLTITDWVQLGRFAAGLDAAAAGAEFQRADCAPRDTKGDGRLTVSDWVQAGRYLGADALVTAGGPTLPVASSSLSVVSRQSPAVGRQLSMIRGQPQRTTDNGQRTISIELGAQGNENALSFSLRFNPAQWRFVSATVGSDAVGATLHVNDLAAKTGGVGVALALPAGRTLAAGTRQILVFRFAPVSIPSGRAAAIEFADFPVAREVVDAEAKVLPASFAANPRKTDSSGDPRRY